MASAAIFADKLIRDQKIVLFSRTYSPECAKVKSILAKYTKVREDTIFIVELDGRSDSTQLEDHLLTLSNISKREVPLLFLRGRYWGGYDEVVRFHNERQLGSVIDTAVSEYDPMGARNYGEEVVMKYAEVDRTEVVVKFSNVLDMVTTRDNAEDQRLCHQGNEEGRPYNPWDFVARSAASESSDSSVDKNSLLLEASSSLHSMRRGSR